MCVCVIEVICFVSLSQGILLEHQEKEFGDKVNTESVLEAVKKIVQK